MRHTVRESHERECIYVDMNLYVCLFNYNEIEILRLIRAVALLLLLLPHTYLQFEPDEGAVAERSVPQIR